MTREIKFRAWDKKEGKMMDEEWCINQAIWQLNPDESIYEWQQFTGLKDKNGKEIYEGDVVKATSWEPGGEERYKIEVVKWNNDEGARFDPFRHARECEVIGNIHENPELLK